jgi:2-oxo-3-hexenedioate decarboxylase
VLTDDEVRAAAEELLDADARATTVEPFTSRVAGFDLAAAHTVLATIAERRRAQGWVPVGRKVGFTNTTIWEAYGVDRPMWAPVWDRTLHWATHGVAALPLGPFVEPRIEPEVVFKLAKPVLPTDDPLVVLDAIEWVAAGFEVVRSPFPGWRFALPDCTAAFGLHGALVVGPPVQMRTADAAELAATLAAFEVTLYRSGSVVDRGIGANVLGSPALALAHLARTLAEQPGAPSLAAGEIVTTGTITDAWPIVAGETWSSTYGSLGLDGLTVTFT